MFSEQHSLLNAASLNKHFSPRASVTFNQIIYKVFTFILDIRGYSSVVEQSTADR